MPQVHLCGCWKAPNVTNTTLGFCTSTAANVGSSALQKAFAPIDNGLVPSPLAFFPLTPLQPWSITLPRYNVKLNYGTGSSPSMLFDMALSCSEVPPLAPARLQSYTTDPQLLLPHCQTTIRFCVALMWHGPARLQTHKLKDMSSTKSPTCS